MVYFDFIKSIQQYQTERVRALNFEDSCSTEKIPDKILLLTKNIIDSLESKINIFCKPNQVIALFALQACVMSIKSNYPILTSRIIDSKQPRTHLCCSLHYLKLPKDRFHQTQTWHGADTIIIDFTTGLMMDNQNYLSRLFKKFPKGHIYNTLNSVWLDEVWTMIGNDEGANSNGY